jgi:predicted Zn-dependent protease
MEAALANLPTYIDPGSGLTAPRILMALIEGDYAAASAVLAASTQTYFQDVDFSFHYPRAWYEAQIARAAGDHARMVTAFAAARKVLTQPGYEGNPRVLAVVAQVDAGLGNNALALQEAKEAVEQMPISKDAYDGPLVPQGLAQVYVMTGEKEKAEQTLETLVKVSGYLAYGFLLRDPIWASLRNDAPFQKIVNSLALRTNAF